MPSVDFPVGIVLAGGLSTRMGSCKQLLPLCGKPLIQYTIEILLEAGLTNLVITVNPFTRETVKAIFKAVTLKKTSRRRSLSCEFVVNTEPDRGQGSSAALAVKTAVLTRPSGFLFCTADQPFLNAESVARLCTVFRNNSEHIVSSAFGERRCSPAVFPFSLSQELMQLNGANGGREVINVHKDILMLSQLGSEIEMFDIDTPADFRYAEQYLHKRQSAGQKK
ncbi:MAG: nucleotidyltransferase family protein [Treponema sp.]